MSVISISLPEPLVAAMDDAIVAEGAAGRSAFIRAAIRNRTTLKRNVGHMHGSITIAYPHGNESHISEARHAFHDVVLSMMHTHCDPGSCMDVLLVGGDASRIHTLHNTLERMRHVEQAVLVWVSHPNEADDANAAAL